MAKIVIPITVDVASKNVFPAIIAKQDDVDSRFLNVTFTNKGNPMSIATTSSVTINALRADGEAKSFAGEVSSDGTVVVPLAHWMLELDDTVKCDVSVIDSEGRKLTSTLFYVEVEEAANDDGVISEDDENYDVALGLQTRMSSAEERLDKAITSNSTLAFNAEGKLIYATNRVELDGGHFCINAPEATEIILGENVKNCGGAFGSHKNLKKVYVYSKTAFDMVDSSGAIGNTVSIELIENTDFSISKLISGTLSDEFSKITANEENISNLLKQDCTIGLNAEGTIVYLSTSDRFSVQEFTLNAPETTTFVLGKNVEIVHSLAFEGHKKVSNIFTFSDDLTVSIASNNENIAVATITKYNYVAPLLKTVSALNAYKPVESSGNLTVSSGSLFDGYINSAKYDCQKIGKRVYCQIEIDLKAITTGGNITLSGLPYTCANSITPREYCVTSNKVQLIWAVMAGTNTLTVINPKENAFADNEKLSFLVTYKTA